MLCVMRTTMNRLRTITLTMKKLTLPNLIQVVEGFRYLPYRLTKAKKRLQQPELNLGSLLLISHKQHLEKSALLMLKIEKKIKNVHNLFLIFLLISL
jgi:hypothetical protein